MSCHYNKDLSRMFERPKWHLVTTNSRQEVSKNHSMKAINICLIFCSVIGALLGLGYLFFDPLVKHMILQNLVLREDSQFSHIWRNPPITPHLKVYFFNFTNPEAFFEGLEKPHLQEVGPYTYSQKWIKENVVWYPNGTMSYSTRKLYTFEPSMSVGDHSSDVITTANVPVISAYHQNKDSNFFISFGIEKLVHELNYTMWTSKTVEELIWGYNETLFAWAQFALEDAPPYKKFGFFIDKNDSTQLPTYTMFTGEADPYKLSLISKFNGEENLKYWKKDSCNKVHGSDGATYNPYIHKDDTLWFFNDQLCRSMPLVFSEEVTSRGLPGYRFVPSPEVFMSAKTYAENECFCVDKDICDMIGDGMFDISKCQFGAPVVLSWPHFLGASEIDVTGISPGRPDLHGFSFDVQPTTGTTLAARARIQVNLAVKATTTFEGLSKINDTVLPILWFEEGLEELGDDLVDVIAAAVVEPPKYKNYLFCVFMGVFTSTVVISLVACVRLFLNRLHRRPNSAGGTSFFMTNASVDGAATAAAVSAVSTAVSMEEKDEDDFLNAAKLIIKSGNFRNCSDLADSVEKRLLEDEDEEETTTTAESSRAPSATHSRNTSTGSTSLGSRSETQKLIVDEPTSKKTVKA